MNKTYMCIDLKSFYASVECVERKLDPIKTNLVVADASRTDKTICLAVTPSLKKYGLSTKSRLKILFLFSDLFIRCDLNNKSFELIILLLPP